MSAGPLFGVRREHAIDATAAAATALGSQGGRAVAAAPKGSTLDEKLNVARRHPPARSGRQLPPGGPAQPGAIRSARMHRPRGRRLLSPSSDRCRACCALGRAGTPTSWITNTAVPAGIEFLYPTQGRATPSPRDAPSRRGNDHAPLRVRLAPRRAARLPERDAEEPLRDDSAFALMDHPDPATP